MRLAADRVGRRRAGVLGVLVVVVLIGRRGRLSSLRSTGAFAVPGNEFSSRIKSLTKANIPVITVRLAANGLSRGGLKGLLSGRLGGTRTFAVPIQRQQRSYPTRQTE